jgi:hypothetical protein
MHSKIQIVQGDAQTEPRDRHWSGIRARDMELTVRAP